MKINFSAAEIRHILISAAALSVAFAVALFNGVYNTDFTSLPRFIAFAFVAVGIGFLAHELIGHKVVAQRFGLFAEYKMWNLGLLIALLFSFFAGVVFAAPGAVYISQRMDLWGRPVHVTRKRMGIVGVMGPAVNVVVAVVFLALAYFSPLYVYGVDLFTFAASINMWLALFNMLPVPPLDGSKVLAWDKRIFAASFIAIAALWYFTVYLWPNLLVQQALIQG